MNWLFFGFFGTLLLAAAVAVIVGVAELVCDIIEFNDNRRVKIVKASAFIVGFVLAGGGWLVVVTILPFWGVWSLLLLLATPAVGVAGAMYGLS